MNSYFVYILTNAHNTVFYIGMTNNLEKRICQHKNELIRGFTKQYQIKKLVWFEETNSVYEAIALEKKIKRWKREWKLNIIKQKNASLEDLAVGWFG